MIHTRLQQSSLLAALLLLLLLAPLCTASSTPDIIDQVRAGFAVSPLLPRQDSTNLQTFTGALGGAVAPPVTSTSDPKRPFAVDGDTFTTLSDAAGRSCDEQHNSCAAVANGAASGGLTVGQCDAQNTQCHAAITSGTQATAATPAAALTSQNADFDFFCE